MEMNIENKIDAILENTDKIIQTAKPLAEPLIRWKPASNEWSIMEVLCHVAEATPFWLNEIECWVKHPGAEWGRGLQHEGRLAAVQQADQQEIEEVLRQIESSKNKV